MFKVKVVLVAGDGEEEEELCSTAARFGDPQTASAAYADLRADLESDGRD